MTSQKTYVKGRAGVKSVTKHLKNSPTEMEVMKKLIFMGIDLVRLKALFFDVLLDFI